MSEQEFQALRALVDYSYDEERADYEEQGGSDAELHIFPSIMMLREYLERNGK